MNAICRIAIFATCCGLGGSALAAGDPVRGRQLYEGRCTACHSLEYNGVGPAHQGVFGRKAGSAPNYQYSPAVRASGIVWNEANLARWLSDPEKLIPGQKMGFSVPSAEDRADIIAYLKQATATPPQGDPK